MQKHGQRFVWKHRRVTRKARKEMRRKYGGKLSAYQVRDKILAELGFSSYKDYLASDLWAAIRQTVFSAKSHYCTLCRRFAGEVHHSFYDLDTLRGKKLDYLHPICHQCHHAIEFPRGNKVSLRVANQLLLAT